MIWLQLPLLYFLGCISVVTAAHADHQEHRNIAKNENNVLGRAHLIQRQNATTFSESPSLPISTSSFSSSSASNSSFPSSSTPSSFITTSSSFTPGSSFPSTSSVTPSTSSPAQESSPQSSVPPSSTPLTSSTTSEGLPPLTTFPPPTSVSTSTVSVTTATHTDVNGTEVPILFGCFFCPAGLAGLLLFGIPDVPGVYPPPLTPPFPGFPT
ncbi:hypothetical protein RRF57_008628 [Xylaria bambusicola]|uniref:Uncharacterized protein n=1 Tax=Xylaria bambusicola TaxID=326684 RepID=A0AAN7V1X2_9PEZI